LLRERICYSQSTILSASLTADRLLSSSGHPRSRSSWQADQFAQPPTCSLHAGCKSERSARLWSEFVADALVREFYGIEHKFARQEIGSAKAHRFSQDSIYFGEGQLFGL